ncbi:hypothetical protein L1887_48602 [Cichorium endivia]|nr:hypothetical protein L1887_48602 [Cichorium endivia]
MMTTDAVAVDTKLTGKEGRAERKGGDVRKGWSRTRTRRRKGEGEAKRSTGVRRRWMARRKQAQREKCAAPRGSPYRPRGRRRARIDSKARERDGNGRARTKKDARKAGGADAGSMEISNWGGRGKRCGSTEDDRCRRACAADSTAPWAEVQRGEGGENWLSEESHDEGKWQHDVPVEKKHGRIGKCFFGGPPSAVWRRTLSSERPEQEEQQQQRDVMGGRGEKLEFPAIFGPIQVARRPARPQLAICRRASGAKSADCFAAAVHDAPEARGALPYVGR